MPKEKIVKKKTTIDDLAIMIGKGFSHVDKRFEQVDKRLSSLGEGQEDIKMKLDNVAYRFELVELQKRVEILERRVGV